MPTSLIVGTGRALGGRVVTNDELAGLMDTSDDWIRARTGIRERRWLAPGETGVELGRRAAAAALKSAGLHQPDLDAIVYATVTPDHFIPGNGILLQRALGLAEIPAIDIRMQCAGFVYALSLADAYVRLGTYRRILVVGQEVQSTRMDVSTRGRHTAVLFADGAGAVVLAACEEPRRGILAIDVHSDGTHVEKLWVDGPGALENPPVSVAALEAGRYYLQMDGKEVFRHAVLRMPQSVRRCLSGLGFQPSDIGLLIAHQANLRIAQAVQK